MELWSPWREFWILRLVTSVVWSISRNCWYFKDRASIYLSILGNFNWMFVMFSLLGFYQYHTEISPRLWRNLRWNQGNRYGISSNPLPTPPPPPLPLSPSLLILFSLTRKCKTTDRKTVLGSWLYFGYGFMTVVTKSLYNWIPHLLHHYHIFFIITSSVPEINSH